MPDVFVARQPIFNRKLDVVGYELLFRGGHVNEAVIANPEGATATVVLNSFTEIGLERIVGCKTAWVNVSREFVLSGLAEAVPAGLVGLEILEDEVIDDELIAALASSSATATGSRSTTSATGPTPSRCWSSSTSSSSTCSRSGASSFARARGALEAVRGHAAGREARDARGPRVLRRAPAATCSRGSSSASPSCCATAGSPPTAWRCCRSSPRCTDPAVELPDVEHLIGRDVALSFRLLRYINSAFFGLRCEVRSIGQALALLGVENLRRWATLSVLAEHRRQASRADAHRARPRPLLRARRRAARHRPSRESCSRSGCSR